VCHVWRLFFYFKDIFLIEMIWFCGLGFLSFRCFCWSCSRIIEIIAAPPALAVWLHPKRNEIRSEEDERQKCHGVHRMHTRVRLPVYRKAIIIWSNIQQQLLLVGEIDQLKHLARHAGKTSFAAKGYEAVRIQFLYFPPSSRLRTCPASNNWHTEGDQGKNKRQEMLSSSDKGDGHASTSRP
jgi:hypothetical protein